MTEEATEEEEGRKEGRREPGVSEQKQKPHTKMWGIIWNNFDGETHRFPT